MSEENGLMSKPKKIWNDALKVVKGENTNQLVEDFTAEMTLVAEGLCEDQNKLRGEVNRLLTEEDRRIQQLDSRIGVTEASLEEQQRENDRVVTELRNRLAALEKQLAREAKAPKEKKKERSTIREITVLIIVAAVSVIAVALALHFL